MASLSIGTYSSEMECKAGFGFILGMSDDLPDFGSPVSKLTFLSITAPSILLERATQLRLVPVLDGMQQLVFIFHRLLRQEMAGMIAQTIPRGSLRFEHGTARRCLSAASFLFHLSLHFQMSEPALVFIFLINLRLGNFPEDRSTSGDSWCICGRRLSSRT